MGKLLYIRSSPRGEASHSIAVADAFVAAYEESHPRDSTETIDLFAAKLPAFDGATLEAKYAILHGKPHTRRQAAAWEAVEAAIAEFAAADRYVFAVPMWNFGIPYPLKHYLDVIIQPGHTFSFSPEEGYRGLLAGKKAFIACARGGEYPEGPEGDAYDFQKRYLALALGFMGIVDIRWAIVQPTLQGGPETAARKREEAIAEARRLAKEF